MQLEKELQKEQQAKVSVQVKVDKSSVNETRENVIKNLKKNLKVPGFRKGKVPENIILKRFPEDIKSKTISRVLQDSLSQVVQESEYNPISQPVVTKMGELAPDEDFSFSAEFDVMPEVKLASYTGINTEKYLYDVDDEAINQEIHSLRERFSTLVNVDEEARVGTHVVIDYGKYNQEGSLEDWKKNQTLLLENEKDQLTRQLIGLKKGDKKDITLDEKYTDQQGEEKEFQVKLQVKVNEVKKKELPELNDDLAKDISDVDTLDELKSRIKERLEEEASRLSDERTRQELLNKVKEKSDFDIPETMVNQETERLIAEVARSYNFDVEKLKQDQETYEKYRKNLRPRAIDNLKTELVLSEIAKSENLKVEEEEIDEEIKKYAEQNNRDFNKVKKTMQKNNTIQSLNYRLRLNKAMDFLYENANFTKEKHLKLSEEEENT
ncbi:MAG: trigger factor [Spirochaetota bacterium]